MAVRTERLTGSRRLVTPRNLAVLFLALASVAVLTYAGQRREAAIPRVDGLTQSSVENSGAFARERGAPATEPVFGSGAYMRELGGTASVVLTPAAIQNSAAHVREVGAEGTIAGSFAAWTFAREAMGPEIEALSPNVILNSGAHLREDPN